MPHFPFVHFLMNWLARLLIGAPQHAQGLPFSSVTSSSIAIIIIPAYDSAIFNNWQGINYHAKAKGPTGKRRGAD